MKINIFSIPDFTFTESEQFNMENVLLTINKSPYIDYLNFQLNTLDKLEKNKSTFEKLIYFCKKIKNTSREEKPFWYIKNSPIDRNIPIFDNIEPVKSKYKLKKTYISEAFLEIFSQLTDNPLLAYETRNNGDFFHDIYPQDQYNSTQTQKTYGELYFHNDRTAHHVRSDYLNLLGLRSDTKNKVLTGYVDGKDILRLLDKESQTVLREPIFVTPFDNLSKSSHKDQIESQTHSILENDFTFRFYLNRTYVNSEFDRGEKALKRLEYAIKNAEKSYVYLQPGDFISFPNLNGLHSKELKEINNYKSLKERWILKTYSFKSSASKNKYLNYYTNDSFARVKEK